MNKLKAGLVGGAMAASMLLLAPVAGAATADGTVGTTSLGRVDVNIYIPNLVLIQDLDPINLNYIAGSDAVATEAFCVWATAGTTYDIAISSANGTNAFVATSGVGNVSYVVDFDHGANGIGWTPVVEGVALDNAGVGYAGAGGVPPGCAGGDNAAIRVTAAELGNLDAATAGVFSDELTLLVSAI